jgi:hypothetical protein
VKSWLKKLIDLLTEKQGLVLLRLSFNPQNRLGPQTSRSNTIQVCPLCGVVPVNWTVHNKWCRFVSETKSTDTVLVGTGDGAVRVPLDRVGPMRSAFEKTSVEKSKKKNFLTYSHELTPERSEKDATFPPDPRPSGAERQKQLSVQCAHPAEAVPDIRCVKCDATRTQLAARGDSGPCCNPFLTCSYELLWRSLPSGEDR